jgi:hypothetical protein
LYYWPGLAKDVESFVSTCDSCQRVKARRQKPYGELQPLQIPGRRWESVSMDLITDLPQTKLGYDSIVVFVDGLSKKCHHAACNKTITAEALARVFQHCVFKHHELPQDVVSDRDVWFEAIFWQELTNCLGIKLNRSTAKHPQTDGQTENANGILEDTLRHFVGPYQNDWDELLPVAEFAMNNAWNKSIQNTPFMLNYGQNPDTPTVAFLCARNPKDNGFVGRWSAQLLRAKACLRVAQERQKAYADRKRQAAPEFQVGDHVLSKISHFRLHKDLKAKLAPQYVGPFEVLERIGIAGLAHRIALPEVLQRVHPVFPVSSLKRYYSDGNYQPPPIPELVDGELEYEVDFIASTRGEGKRRQYLVYWTGYPNEPTWENEKNLVNCAEAVKTFWEVKGLPCSHPLCVHN